MSRGSTPSARVFLAPGGYRTVTIHRSGETVAPLARPETTIAVDALLP